MGIYETTVNQDREESYLAIGYKDFNYNICDTINKYRDNFPGRPGINCKKDGNDYYIASSTTTIDNIWPELTSKIRLS